jgi:hypothetical protein
MWQSLRCLWSGTSLLLLLLLGTLTFAEAERPNIVVIFCDDLCDGDLSCFGRPTIRTPQLDRRAREGQKWSSFYCVAPVCTFSRAGLSTGRALTLAHASIVGDTTWGRASARMKPRIGRRLRICTDQPVVIRAVRLIRGSLASGFPPGQAIVIPETVLRLALRSKGLFRDRCRSGRGCS